MSGNSWPFCNMPEPRACCEIHEITALMLVLTLQLGARFPLYSGYEASISRRSPQLAGRSENGSELPTGTGQPGESRSTLSGGTCIRRGGLHDCRQTREREMSLLSPLTSESTCRSPRRRERVMSGDLYRLSPVSGQSHGGVDCFTSDFARKAFCNHDGGHDQPGG